MTPRWVITVLLGVCVVLLLLTLASLVRLW